MGREHALRSHNLPKAPAEWIFVRVAEGFEALGLGFRV